MRREHLSLPRPHVYHSALRAAASLAAKQDLDHFLSHRLPQLAEVLASRDQLLEVLQRLDECEAAE